MEIVRKNCTEKEKIMRIGNKDFDVDHKTYIMGILNCTPDSFSDGGKYNDIDRAIKHVEEMIRDGADIIDVGGESTRPLLYLNPSGLLPNDIIDVGGESTSPGYTIIPDEEEIERVVPVIEKIKANFDIPVSIDTYKSKVADAAVIAGADLVNDIWGCKYDKKIADVIAKRNVACCLMHNRDLEKNPYGNDVMYDVLNDLQESIDIALKAGVAKNKIITDPGIGFGKTLQDNLNVMNNVDWLKELGYPILLGTSKKSMIGLTLDVPKDERVEGTLVTTVMGVMKGCAFIRVHDVLENKRAVVMTEAILSA